MAAHSFAAHMSLHMLVVAAAAPLVALRADGARCVAPTQVGMAVADCRLGAGAGRRLDLACAARSIRRPAHGGPALAIEQASFLAAGLVLWVAVTGGASRTAAAATLARRPSPWSSRWRT